MAIKAGLDDLAVSVFDGTVSVSERIESLKISNGHSIVEGGSGLIVRMPNASHTCVTSRKGVRKLAAHDSLPNILHLNEHLSHHRAQSTVAIDVHVTWDGITGPPRNPLL